MPPRIHKAPRGKVGTEVTDPDELISATGSWIVPTVGSRSRTASLSLTV